MPKFIGPYSDSIWSNKFGPSFSGVNSCGIAGHSWEISRRDIPNVFHLSIHVANDDHLFPRWSAEQVPDLDGHKEWVIRNILTHRGSHSDATLEVQWVTGDPQVRDEKQLYFEAVTSPIHVRALRLASLCHCLPRAWQPVSEEHTKLDTPIDLLWRRTHLPSSATFLHGSRCKARQRI